MYVFGLEQCRKWEGEWITGLGVGFIKHVGTGVVFDICLCLGCGGVDG